MTDYNFGDIVLEPFPFTDQSIIKKRPAVVVSSGVYNRQRPDVVIMAITSQMRSANYFGDTIITDWTTSGLLKPSVFKPIFTTVESRSVIKVIVGALLVISMTTAAYAAKAHPEKKTIFGASYSAFLFDEKGPNRNLLDKIVPDRPVFLMDHTLHSVWVNSKALEMAGITKKC